MATRIDRRAPGPVTVHGPLARDADGGLRIGALPVSPDAGIDVRPGGYVVASGPLSGGRMLARSVAADRLLTDLPASFGPGVGRFVVESYIGWDGGYLRPDYGLGPVAPPLQGGAAGRGVLDLRREPGRGIVATGLRNAPFATGAVGGGPMGPQAPAMGSGRGGGAAGQAAPRGTPGAARAEAVPMGANDAGRAGGRWEPAPVPGGRGQGGSFPRDQARGQRPGPGQGMPLDGAPGGSDSQGVPAGPMRGR